MKKNKKLIYLIIAISFIAISAIGATYAYFLASGYSNKTSTVSVTADALDEVSCTATDLSMTVTGSDMKQGSSSATGTVAKTNNSSITCTATKHTTGTTECTMDIKYTPASGKTFTKSSNNSNSLKELTLSGTGTTTNGVINTPVYNEIDMSTLTSTTTLISGLKWIFDSNDTLTYTMTSKFYNYDFNQNDLANHTYGGTISVANITCAGVSPTYETVTLNANGGSVSSSSKQVINGYTYGTLPTPTKSGATFKGWHGKNLINLDVPLINPSSTNGDKTTPRTFTPSSYVEGLAFDNYYNPNCVKELNVTPNSIELIATSGYGIGIPIISSSNKKYTLSFDSNGTDNRGYSLLYYDVSGNLITYSQFGITNTHITNKFTTQNNTYYLVLEFYGTNENTNVILSNLQLEEGNTATTYEPYYITKDSVVNINGNHTLTALWQ